VPTAVAHEQHRARPGTALRLDRELTCDCEDLEGPRSVLREDVSITLALSQLPAAIMTCGQLPGSHSLRGVTVLGVVYILVRAVHAQHLEQNASSVRNVVHPGSGKSARSE
jgi:hypothetical protein